MSTRDTTLAGASELDRLLQTLPTKMEKNIMRTALRAGANVYLQEIKQNIPVSSGALRDSARITTRAKKGQVSASVKVGNAQAWYAHLVEFGTRPHVIKPKNRGGAMHFGGIEAREVNHPGTRARPFMRPAADSKFQESVDAVQAKIRERLNKQGIDTPAPVPMDSPE